MKRQYCDEAPDVSRGSFVPVFEWIVRTLLYPDETQPTLVCLQGLRATIAMSSTSRHQQGVLRETLEKASKWMRALFYCELCQKVHNNAPIYDRSLVGHWYCPRWEECCSRQHQLRTFEKTTIDSICTDCFIWCRTCYVGFCSHCLASASQQRLFRQCGQCRRYWCYRCYLHQLNIVDRPAKPDDKMPWVMVQESCQECSDEDEDEDDLF